MEPICERVQMLYGCELKRLLFILLASFLLIDSPLRADEVCKDAECYVQMAKGLLDKGEAKEAIALLKQAVSSFPESRDAGLLLGIAYVKDNNLFWALKTFLSHLERFPSDCEARAWLAWVYLEQGSLHEAWAMAKPEICKGLEGARLALVRALVAHARNERAQVRKALEEAKRQGVLWDSDRVMYAQIQRIATPEDPPELMWRLETQFGWTTNALLGSPNDMATGAGIEGRTALAYGDAYLRFMPRLVVRPSVEAFVKGMRFTDESVRGLSWMNLGARIGFLYGDNALGVFVGYKTDYLLLAQGDPYSSGPLWFFNGHRGEVEAYLTKFLLAFFGAGTRTFRERARTRTEVDGGVGTNLRLYKSHALLAAFSARKYFANVKPWSVFGISALAYWHWQLPKDFLVKTGLLWSLDVYPESKGYQGFQSPNKDRTDNLIKASVSLWSPSFKGVRLGLAYDYSWRHSTVDIYAFSDHRVTMRVVWGGESEIFLPKKAGSDGLFPMQVEDKAGEGFVERIQDLLRQDEQVQRSSSCVQ
jgi:tetratricopeptide (TPR) repeat protein